MDHPFQTQEYKRLFKQHFVPDAKSCVTFGDIEFEVLPDRRAVLIGMKHVLNGQEITDFGPLSLPESISTIHTTLKTNHMVKTVQYDYIRQDSSAYSTLTSLTSSPPIVQEVSPFITLPSTWEAYLESLERTDRKELKRKLNRLETVPHSLRIFEYSESESSFEDFIRLHKLSTYDKDMFMTEDMMYFFKDLFALAIPNWKQKLAFLFVNEQPAAAIFYFESEDSILLYNSGFDPEQKYYSVGLLLTAKLIQHAINSNKKIFDFLRGNERYKYDLGGKDTSLLQFTFDL